MIEDKSEEDHAKDVKKQEYVEPPIVSRRGSSPSSAYTLAELP